MLEIQKKSLDKALDIIRALGCTFAVRTPNGTIIDGGLAVKQRQSKQGLLPGIPRKPRRDFSGFGIREKVAALKPGDVVEIDSAGTPFSVADLQCNLSSSGIARFGSGNFTCCRVGTKVQGLRVK